MKCQCIYCKTADAAEDTVADEVKAFHDSHDFIALAEALRTAAGEVENASSEAQNSHDNMESAFPNGCPTMEMLQGRIDTCERISGDLEDAASTIENLNPEEPGEEDEADESEEISDELQNAIDEAVAAAEGIDWSCE